MRFKAFTNKSFLRKSKTAPMKQSGEKKLYKRIQWQHLNKNNHVHIIYDSSFTLYELSSYIKNPTMSDRNDQLKYYIHVSQKSTTLKLVFM